MAEPKGQTVAARIGGEIRLARTRNAMSQVSLAQASGVSRRMLTQIELGQANPSLATIDKLAAALGTTLPALVGVRNSPPPEGVQVWSLPAGSWSRIIDAVETDAVSVELWRWHLVAGDAYEASPAPDSPHALAYVVVGQLIVTSVADQHVVDVGKSARLSAAPAYTLTSGAPSTDFTLVVTIPR